MTTIDERTRPNINEMYVVHRVFRRESDLLPRMVRAVPAGDIARAALIAEHFRHYQAGLHEHHTGEDELLWPLLLARVDLEAELVLRMEAQHEDVAGTLGFVEELLPEWERTADPTIAGRIATALVEHQNALHEHLADEERYILPLVEEHITAQEWNRLGERFAEETPKDKLLLFLGALLEEATPDERAHLMGNLPLPARLAWRLLGKNMYAKRAKALRAGL